MALGVRYLEERKRATVRSGSSIVYFYNPPKDVRDAGILKAESLGGDPEIAKAKAEEYNRILDQWRADNPKGTLQWAWDFFTQSLQFEELSPKTQTEYRKYAKTLLGVNLTDKLLGEYRIDRITVGMAVDTYRRLRKTNGDAMAMQSVGLGRRIYEVLRLYDVWRQYNIRDNPFARLGVRKGRARGVVWEPEQIAAFCDKAIEMGWPSVALAAMLAFELVQRPGDILDLRWEDYKDGEFYVEQNKTGAKVWVPVSDTLREFLKTVPRSSEHVCVCESTRQPWMPNYFRRIVADIRQSANLPSELQIRDLRRTGATELSDTGATEDELMAVGGWKSRQVVSVYSRATRVKARAAQMRRFQNRNKEVA